MTDYVMKFMCSKEKRPSAKREETGFSSKHVFTAETSKEQLASCITAATSVKKAQIGKASKKTLLHELARLRAISDEVPTIPESANKGAHVDAVLEWRMKLFKADSTLKEKLEAMVTDEVYGECTEPGRSEELERKFFSHVPTGVRTSLLEYCLEL